MQFVCGRGTNISDKQSDVPSEPPAQMLPGGGAGGGGGGDAWPGWYGGEGGDM